MWNQSCVDLGNKKAFYGRLEGTLNSSIAEIVDWAASNKLPINEGKTKAHHWQASPF